ncbi:uncharacterized protein LOC142578141 isoform X6 [Dermacentor variabilis]|uniref:uncharacterized protein LOC142578141 isoform X6 n=1 Tax=Dermacentor variabilis TaxID=34621 RepID=UPI003F5CAF5F
MATVRSTRWRQHTCTPLQFGRRRREEEEVAFCSRQKKRKKAAQRASAVSGEGHKPSGQCFMAADGQIYWQPTPQRSAAPRGYKPEAPDSRQGAAKIVDPADGAQQHTAAAEPRERKPTVLLFLACSVAFVAVAVAVILVYTFGTPATARRLKSPRFCGDVPSWRTNRLKNDFMKCSEESCSKIACGPINDTWCLTGAPPFDSKCECCDWCIVRDLVCGKRARMSSGSNPYASCQASCGRL